VRECERADRLVTELIKMTSDLMEAKETAAKLRRTGGGPFDTSRPSDRQAMVGSDGRNLTTACASLATALREVLDERFWGMRPARQCACPPLNGIMEAIHEAWLASAGSLPRSTCWTFVSTPACSEASQHAVSNMWV
jgi:hypothetical protein